MPTDTHKQKEKKAEMHTLPPRGGGVSQSGLNSEAAPFVSCISLIVLFDIDHLAYVAFSTLCLCPPNTYLLYWG